MVEFVKKWRHKRFCTSQYIKREMRLQASTRTLCRVLNEHGYYWKPVPKVQGISKEHLAARAEFVNKYANRTPAWWQEHMHMVLDGVTLTMPPKTLSGREKHAAQRLTSMWMCSGERLQNDVHTYNRYGIQLGTKIPLWGGFSGGNQFTLRLWTSTPKMTREEWEAQIPFVKAAIDDAYGDGAPSTAWVWHDNERFLLCPEVYKAHGMKLVRFPPNSGDLNPIETVWAWLRRDLMLREQADIQNGRWLTPQQFRQRCAQLLHSYSVPFAGERFSPLQKLIRGMPRRLQRCRANSYGRCGK